MESILGFRMMRKFVLDRFWIPHHAEEEILKKIELPHDAEVRFGYG